jgi:4-hydroxybenzoate polyprenyltransferase
MVQSPNGSAICVDAAHSPGSALPLCVDLDGTLINSNLLWECIIQLFKSDPFCLLLVPFWLLVGGRPNLKRQLARRSRLEPEKILYNRELLEFLQTEHERGRKIILVTAADQQLAEDIAAHTGVFDEVHGTSGGQNLKGRTKADFLRTAFGDRGFEYAGDSFSDMHIWRAASAAYVVGTKSTAERAASVTELLRWFPRKNGDLTCWSRAIRIRHWSKNLLMLAPLLLAHRFSCHSLLLTLVGMALFGLCSSGIYILNDLLDLHSDRAHPWNSGRPFASGQLSICSGIMMSLFLLGTSLGLGALAVNGRFAGALALYAVTASMYSMRLKRMVIFDVFVLSSFYTFRIWAGALITDVPLSQWFMGFSLFFFLSLAMAKRYSELVHASELADSGNSGRSYRASDRELLMNIGMASCFSAIVILSLYVHSNEVMALYQRPGLLLLMCPLILYWACRIWLKAHRGELNEDPINLAISDPVSYYVAAAGLLVMLASSIKF